MAAYCEIAAHSEMTVSRQKIKKVIFWWIKQIKRIQWCPSEEENFMLS